MHSIVICANNNTTEFFPFTAGFDGNNFPTDLPAFTINHEMKAMVTPEVIGAMIEQWKKIFHPADLPIDQRYENALRDFLNWLKEKPYGYVIPDVRENLVILPIYDIVEEPL